MFADFVCLVIQGAGGGIAGTAATQKGADNGAYIMTGGVILQRTWRLRQAAFSSIRSLAAVRVLKSAVVITVLFVFLLVDFVLRYRAGRPAVRQRHPLPNWGFLRRRENPYADGHQLQAMGTTPKGPGGLESGAPSLVAQEMTSKGVWTMVGMLSLTTLLIVIR
jgi:hypothetical protein